MAKLVYGLNQSLDGYVDHQAFSPSPSLFRHFIAQVRGLTGSLYGRRMYEVMRYWDDDLPDWVAEERDFAAAWRGQPKWVVSRSLKSVGPNAILVEGDIEAVVRGLKAEHAREIEVAGPELAQSLTDLGLIDEYRLYLHPRRAWSRQAILRRPPAAAPPCRQRSRWRGHDQVDVRSRLNTLSVRRIAPTRSKPYAGRRGAHSLRPA
jgi:dihydrofolate reductase